MTRFFDEGDDPTYITKHPNNTPKTNTKIPELFVLALFTDRLVSLPLFLPAFLSISVAISSSRSSALSPSTVKRLLMREKYEGEKRRCM
jgi:hypothetical protein